MNIKRYERYVCGAPLLLLPIVAALAACGASVDQQPTLTQREYAQKQAQDFLDSMQLVCRDGREYLVGVNIREYTVAPTGANCFHTH